MPKTIIVEFSPNGILGRVTGPDTIIYPGVFLGLPFDVHMPRGIPVFGPDVEQHTDVATATRPKYGIMESTLPESTPATADAATHPVTGVSVFSHNSTCNCPYCNYTNSPTLDVYL